MSRGRAVSKLITIIISVVLATSATRVQGGGIIPFGFMPLPTVAGGNVTYQDLYDGSSAESHGTGS